MDGEFSLTIEGTLYDMRPGSYAFIPPAAKWSVRNTGAAPVRFHWIRKGYQAVEGLPYPEAFVTNENDIEPIPMPGTDGKWVTTRFVDMSDMRHDMHVNIVTFEPGAVIPFAETHVMEHGLYVLEGKAVYRLNQDWVEVEAGDYMWLRAFCPQACYSGAGQVPLPAVQGCEPTHGPGSFQPAGLTSSAFAAARHPASRANALLRLCAQRASRSAAGTVRSLQHQFRLLSMRNMAHPESSACST